MVHQGDSRARPQMRFAFRLGKGWSFGIVSVALTCYFRLTVPGSAAVEIFAAKLTLIGLAATVATFQYDGSSTGSRTPAGVVGPASRLSQGRPVDHCLTGHAVVTYFGEDRWVMSPFQITTIANESRTTPG